MNIGFKILKKIMDTIFVVVRDIVEINCKIFGKIVRTGNNVYLQ